MQDRETDTYWAIMEGEAVAGELERLKPLVEEGMVSREAYDRVNTRARVAAAALRTSSGQGATRWLRKRPLTGHGSLPFCEGNGWFSDGLVGISASNSPSDFSRFSIRPRLVSRLLNVLSWFLIFLLSSASSCLR